MNMNRIFIRRWTWQWLALLGLVGLSFHRVNYDCLDVIVNLEGGLSGINVDSTLVRAIVIVGNKCRNARTQEKMSRSPV